MDWIIHYDVDVLHEITFTNNVSYEDLEFYFMKHGYNKYFQDVTLSHRTNLYRLCNNFYFSRKVLKSHDYQDIKYKCYEDNDIEKSLFYNKSPLSQKNYILKRIIYEHPDKEYKFVIENNVYKLEFTTFKNFEQIFYNIYNMFGDIIEKYKKIARYNGFAGTMPTTFEPRYNQKHALNFEGFSVTAKADGFRYNIYIDEIGKFHLIDRKLNSKTILGLCRPEFSNTILDCEKVNEIYYCFDILVIGGKYVEDESLDRRINHLEKFVKKMNNQDFCIKKFYLKFKTGVFEYPGNIKTNFETIYDVIKHVWENKDDYEYKIDGLIFNKISLPFYNHKTFKWKDDHTVDLMFVQDKDNVKLYTMDENSFIPFDGQCKFTRHHDGIVDYFGHKEGIAEFDCKLAKDRDIILNFKKVRYEKEWPNNIITLDNIYNTLVRNVNIEWFMNKKSQLKSNGKEKETSSFGKRTKV